jgi:pimeloyl-ACP methyl ester carboxylesterase
VSDPSTRIPWARIVAEGVAIVGSILLAFALDAWWDRRAERRDELETLTRLAEEFDRSAEILAATQAFQDSVIRASEALLELIGPGAEPGVPTDSVGRLIYGSIRRGTFTPVSGVLGSVLSSGRLRIIISDSLRAELAAWPGLVEDLNEGERFAWAFVDDRYIPYLDERISWRSVDHLVGNEAYVRPSGFERGWMDVLGDRLFENLLGTQHTYTQVILADSEALAERLYRILLLIDRERGVCSTGDATPSEMVSVGTHRLETLVTGEGGPTVVFDAGFSGGMGGWCPVQQLTARHTTTLAYERAGLGRSELGPEPRTAAQIARELHELVRVKGVPKPLILVGHSAGGMFMPLYASMYPEDVAGLVLVDPATADVYQNMYDTDPARWEAFPEEVSSPHAGWRPQWAALLESLQEVRAAGPPVGVPTVVLTGQTLLPGEWALGTQEYMDYWVESHRRLAGSLSDAEHIILPEADHLTILEEAVLPREVLGLVEATRNREEGR